MYCPKCKSRLYSGDQEYIEATGVCSYCVSFDSTPGRRFAAAFDEYRKKKGVVRKHATSLTNIKTRRK